MMHCSCQIFFGNELFDCQNFTDCWGWLQKGLNLMPADQRQAYKITKLELVFVLFASCLFLSSFCSLLTVFICTKYSPVLTGKSDTVLSVVI